MQHVWSMTAHAVGYPCAMPFSPEVAEQLLVKAHRCCCICHKSTGVKMEVHHIVPEADGGDDSFDNGIPLCFDCHSDVEHYNPRHPKGRKFRPSELRKHRDQWFAVAALPPWHRSANVPVPRNPASPPANVVQAIRDLDIWNPDVSERFLPTLLNLTHDQRLGLMRDLEELLNDEDREVRWHAGVVVEFFVQWDPLIVSPDLLVRLSNDPFTSVRGCAAVGYYFQSISSPDMVPVEVLGRLAAHDEDWYVFTPAVNALVQLARTRRAAVEALAQGLMLNDSDAHSHAAAALRKLLTVTPASLLDTVKDRLMASPVPEAYEVGLQWEAELLRRQRAGELLTFYMFP
jgi:hypothetical protein